MTQDTSPDTSQHYHHINTASQDTSTSLPAVLQHFEQMCRIMPWCLNFDQISSTCQKTAWPRQQHICPQFLKKNFSHLYTIITVLNGHLCHRLCELAAVCAVGDQRWCYLFACGIMRGISNSELRTCCSCIAVSRVGEMSCSVALCGE